MFNLYITMDNFGEFFRGKRVLVTGHTGFKGAWLAQVLLNWDAEVIGVSLPPHTSPSLFEILGLEKKVVNYYQDINDFNKVKEIFEKEKPEIVFHLAAQAIVREGYNDPLKTYATNILGTANILHAIKEVGSAKSAVMITSDKVYENKEWVHSYRENDLIGGKQPYSASKAAADIVINSYVQSFLHPEHFGSKHNTLVATGRAGNVIGGGDWANYRVVPDIVRAVYEKNEPVAIRFPRSVRPWEHVLEPVSGYILLAKKLYEGDKSAIGAWNFGPHDESFVSVEELVKKGIGLLGKGSYSVEPDDSKPEAGLLKLDIVKAKSILSWRPRLDFVSNLNFTFDWYKNFYEKKNDPVEFTKNQIDSFFSK